jgi:hypothetical protein
MLENKFKGNFYPFPKPASKKKYYRPCPHPTSRERIGLKSLNFNQRNDGREGYLLIFQISFRILGKKWRRESCLLPDLCLRRFSQNTSLNEAGSTDLHMPSLPGIASCDLFHLSTFVQVRGPKTGSKPSLSITLSSVSPSWSERQVN